MIFMKESVKLFWWWTGFWPCVLPIIGLDCCLLFVSAKKKNPLDITDDEESFSKDPKTTTYHHNRFFLLKLVIYILLVWTKVIENIKCCASGIFPHYHNKVGEEKGRRNNEQIFLDFRLICIFLWYHNFTNWGVGLTHSLWIHNWRKLSI